MIIANKYKIIEKINNGEFGTIFKCENIRTQEYVAIKIEPTILEIKMLKREAQIYQYLGKSYGIPQLKWYGSFDKYNYLVLPLYGDSLLKNKIYSSLAYSFLICKSIIKILQYIHEKGLIHRDIKPDNIVLNSNNTNSDVYIIDFGLCKKYIDTNNNHINITEGKSIIGTPNFISVNIHNGIEPSRRDDLESVAYIMIFLINGILPWQNEKELDIIKNQKNNINLQDIQYINIMKFIKYCRLLEFNETPNYEYLILLLS